MYKLYIKNSIFLNLSLLLGVEGRLILLFQRSEIVQNKPHLTKKVHKIIPDLTLLIIGKTVYLKVFSDLFLILILILDLSASLKSLAAAISWPLHHISTKCFKFWKINEVNQFGHERCRHQFWTWGGTSNNF